jgi:hypothetical protein
VLSLPFVVPPSLDDTRSVRLPNVELSAQEPRVERLGVLSIYCLCSRHLTKIYRAANPQLQMMAAPTIAIGVEIVQSGRGRSAVVIRTNTAHSSAAERAGYLFL